MADILQTLGGQRAAVGHGAPFAVAVGDLTGTAGATRRVIVRLG
ncbi:hypothetical protein ACWDZ8_37905 [Streptomyces sp. NPDC003233]